MADLLVDISVVLGFVCAIGVWVCAWLVARAKTRAAYHEGRVEVLVELSAALGRLNDAHDAINVLDVGGSTASMGAGARREYDAARAEQF